MLHLFPHNKRLAVGILIGIILGVLVGAWIVGPNPYRKIKVGE